MPRGRGVLVATGATLGAVGLLNVAWSASLALDAGAPTPEVMSAALDRLPLVALGAGLLAFAIVRDPGPVSAWLGLSLLGLLATALVGASIVLGTALLEAWREAAALVEGREDVTRAAVQIFLYTAFHLYLAFAVWRSRPRTG